jgi:hypothetical protein
VTVFLVDPARKTGDGRSNAQVMKALDDGDPAAGWPCTAQAGEGVEVDAIAAVWAPGTGPVSFPGNSGVRQPRADQLVIQVHYNVADPRLAGMTDSTTVRLRTAGAVAKRAAFVVQDPFLDTLARPQPDVLPPGQAETTTRWTRTAAALGIPAGATLLGVMPRMHARGVRQELAVGTPLRCAARVEQWSSGWQRLYLYRAPVTLMGGDAQIQMSCTYNTMSDTDPVLPGLALDGELCTAVLMIALPTA